MAEQFGALRAGLRGAPGCGPLVAVYDIRDFVYSPAVSAKGAREHCGLKGSACG